jgi:hypothetical protein
MSAKLGEFIVPCCTVTFRAADITQHLRQTGVLSPCSSRVPDHLVGDAGQFDDLRGDRPLRIDGRVPLVDHLMVTDLDRSDSVTRSPDDQARSLDIDDHVVLLRV